MYFFLWRRWAELEHVGFTSLDRSLLLSLLRCFLSYRALYCLADDERPRLWKPKWALAETTRVPHTSNTSPERFITVIKVLFSSINSTEVTPRDHPALSTQTHSAVVPPASEVGGETCFSIFIGVDITSLDNQLQQIVLQETNCFI